MPRSAVDFPRTDPTRIFEITRANQGTELLVTAVVDFQLFDRLAKGPKSPDDLRREMQLEQRPFVVLLTAIRAMGLVGVNAQGEFLLSPLAQEHLVRGGEFYVGDYVGLAADAPGVRAMAELLKTNRPARQKSDDQGAAFIFREGIESAMDHEASARRLTLALSGRAKNVAPHLAAQAKLEQAQCLLDVGGGSGIYAIACLQRFPNLRAIVWDRPEVLKVAAEFAEEHGVTDRLECRPGDMFADPVPGGCDAILLSNILHDWDLPECQTLVDRCAAALPRGGSVLIHDVFLNDALDGPLEIACYSESLFSITEGRAYSAAEYRAMLSAAGLAPQPVAPTLVHCGILAGMKK